MFSLYTLSRNQKIMLSFMIFVIFYQGYILISSIYHSQRINQQIEIFEKKNEELRYEIEDQKRKYIKNIISSTQELLRKENLGQIVKGEKVIIIKEENSNTDALSSLIGSSYKKNEEEVSENFNYPEKWLLFITGIKL